MPSYPQNDARLFFFSPGLPSHWLGADISGLLGTITSGNVSQAAISSTRGLPHRTQPLLLGGGH